MLSVWSLKGDGWGGVGQMVAVKLGTKTIFCQTLTIKYFPGPFVNHMIWSNIPLKFSEILWMHWGPSSSHYFLYQAQGTHQQHRTKLVKPCPYYNFNFPAFSCNNKFWFDSVYTFGLIQFCFSMFTEVKR